MIGSEDKEFIKSADRIINDAYMDSLLLKAAQRRHELEMRLNKSPFIALHWWIIFFAATGCIFWGFFLIRLCLTIVHNIG